MFSNLWQTVTVKTRTKTGADAFNKPTYTWTEQTLNKVLAKPEDGLDASDSSTRQECHDIKWTLYIPKDYASIDFENAKVRVNSEWYEVVGAPKAYPACPTDYSCVVKVGVKHG